MKKTLIFVLGLSMTMLSCRKEEIKPNSPSEQTMPVLKTNIIDDKEHEKLYITYNSYFQEWDCFCHGEGGNCLPAIDVAAESILDILSTIFDAIASQDDLAVQQLFSVYQSSLETICPGDLILGVIDGDLTVEKMNDANGEPITYLHFHNQSDEIVKTLPIII